MKSNDSVIKINIIYGLIVIVPLAMILLLLAKIVEIIDGVAKPFGFQTATSIVIGMVIGVILLAGLCFVVGSLLRTRIGALSFERFENLVLKKLPGYEIINSLLKGFIQDEVKYPSAMIRLYDSDTEAFGFVVNENEDEKVTVFIPTAPMMTVGNVYVIHRDRVTLLDASVLQVTDCLSHFGIGSEKIMNTKRS